MSCKVARMHVSKTVYSNSLHYIHILEEAGVQVLPDRRYKLVVDNKAPIHRSHAVNK